MADEIFHRIPDPLENPREADESLPETPNALGILPADAQRIGNTRRNVGYVLGGMSMAALALLGWWSIDRLHEVDTPANAFEEHFAYILLGAHAVITIALVYFLYQVLKLAERLILPYWWVDKDPSPVKTMLGVRDPVSAALKLAREALDAVKSVAGKK